MEETLKSEELRSLLTLEAMAWCLMLMADFLYSRVLMMSRMCFSTTSICWESMYAAILQMSFMRMTTELVQRKERAMPKWELYSSSFTLSRCLWIRL
jgi:hypothetical protein